MERLTPDILRSFADGLEDERQLDNIENFRRTPEYDQQMLLALNGARGKGELPDASTIRDHLKERLISVGTNDGQTAMLGIFYTNADPLNKRRKKLGVGVFPLYGEVSYSIRPTIRTDLDDWQRSGNIWVEDKSASGNDPFLIDRYSHLDFVFFRTSPFNNQNRYKSELPSEDKFRLPDPEVHEEALEDNVITRALWYASRGMKPYLFLQKGFETFIRGNKHDPRYTELYQAFRIRSFPRSGWTEYNY